MSVNISAWLIKLDPLHWAEWKSLVYLEANVVVVSLFVVKELVPAKCQHSDSPAWSHLCRPHDHLEQKWRSNNKFKKINSAFENENIITTLFCNIREEICAESFSNSPCRESSNVSLELKNSKQKSNWNCYSLDDHCDATAV